MRAGQKPMRNWKRFYMKNKKWRIFWIFCGGIILCFLIGLMSFCLGTIYFSPLKVIRLLLGKGDRIERSILLYARLPRTLAALFSGAALAVSGAVLQTVLGNRLASPGIIGVNAGAGLGVTLCLAAGTYSGLAISGAAFLGSLITVFLIFLFSYRTNAAKTTVILGGVALNSIWNAAAESVTVLDPEVGTLSIDFRVGGFSAVSYARLIPAIILISLALTVMFTLCNELDVAALGDETALSLGMAVKKYRLIFLSLCALLSGAAVSFAGLLGFVGLIVPHFVRRFSGNESRRLLPLTALFGAGFVTFCDTFSRLIFAPYELPVGILMSVIGGPVFFGMLIKSRHSIN